jgi:membrane protease YdiL (CAAX protease family)
MLPTSTATSLYPRGRLSSEIQQRAALDERRPTLATVLYGIAELALFLGAWSWSSRWAARAVGVDSSPPLDGTSHLAWALLVVPVWSVLVFAAQKLRGERLLDLGLRRPARRWLRALAVGLAAGTLLCALSWGATWLGGALGAQPIEPVFELETPRSLAAFLASGLLAGAFAEELVYRGLLLDRVERLLRLRMSANAATALSLIAVSAFFGFNHRYYGALGMLVTGLVGLGLGLLVLRCGRDLAPAMIAHGVVDVVGLVAHYG